jgi:O-antigen/teichoic acid export membrane protein
MIKAQSIRKDYIWNTVGTSAASFISLLLLIAVTRINGIESDSSGLFSFCFSYACVFFMIGIYGGRIYQLSDVTGEFESKNYIFLKFLTSVCMMVSAVIFVIVNGYDAERGALLLALAVYKMTDALADPLYGVVQRKGRLYWAGISMTMKAVLGFVSFVIADLLTHDMLLASFCLLAANIVFIIAWDIPRMLRLERITGLFKGNLAPSLFLIKSSAFVFVFAMLTNLLPNITRYFIDVYHHSDLGWYGIIIMPATMLNLFVGFVIQPKLVSLSEAFAGKQYNVFDRSVSKIVLVSLSFGILATAVIWLIGCPVLSWIYGIDLYPYRAALTVIVVGGTINTLTMISSNILSIMRRFFIQVAGCLAGTAAAFLASTALVEKYGVGGGAWAFVIAVSVQAVIFFVGYRVILSRLKSR